MTNPDFFTAVLVLENLVEFLCEFSVNPATSDGFDAIEQDGEIKRQPTVRETKPPPAPAGKEPRQSRFQKKSPETENTDDFNME